MKSADRSVRPDMIPPLELGGGFRIKYEGRTGERHRIRLSRHMPGLTLEGTMVELLDELRPMRRPLPGAGITQVAFWLLDSASMHDSLMAASDDE
ncbi:hypothetical protein [Nocardioides zhouii]|uniref:Uncharacterized protein n=1 Tax=Nocardioides zhouii TaxID=1168729 RepID=A0A4Q2SNV4_9ACTN|nr:hypothetical protein [Nocardioides zhouii]RYC05758.1 hypothetical protein EUA94_17820 [Nocardioides zhouii]